MPYVAGTRAQPELPWQGRINGTSHGAAVKAESFAATQRERYYAWLKDRIEGGTDGEAEVELMMRRSSVCARRNELIRQGRVMDWQHRRFGCTVWRAIEVMR